MTNFTKHRLFKLKYRLGYCPGELVRIDFSTEHWCIIGRLIDLPAPTYLLASGRRTAVVRQELIKRV